MKETTGWQVEGAIYALNLLGVADRDEYLAYSRRSEREVEAHGGRVGSLGEFREAPSGDIERFLSPTQASHH